MQSCNSRHAFAGGLLGATLLLGVGFLVPLQSAAGSREGVAEGAALFATSGCTQCHGPIGLGTEKAPSLRDVPKHMNAEQTHTQIHDGGKMMPPFGDALTDEQIAALVDFLHSKNGWKLVEATAQKESPSPAPQ